MLLSILDVIGIMFDMQPPKLVNTQNRDTWVQEAIIMNDKE